MRDAIGRDWQCGTLQVDFVLPQRLGAVYTAEDGTRRTPVMLHRAVFGSLERFTGVLIEHYAGKFPMWLAPLQVAIITVTSESDTYAQAVLSLLQDHNIRCEIDLRNEKINYKIREHSLQKIPYILVLGKREAEQKNVALRTFGSQDTITLSLNEVIEKFVQEARNPADIPKRIG